MVIIITVIVIMGLIGLIFGTIIAFANKKLAVEMNPLIHLVDDCLPKGQCGACGFAGCQAYAEAVVLQKDVPPDLCTPGKSDVAIKVSKLTGKKANVVESKIAMVRCFNPIGIADKIYTYSGINDCVAASILYLGPKDCKYGCIGLGSCVHHCPFGAITLREDGLPIVNEKKCTGCGKCETICPKGILKMFPVKAKVEVLCSSNDTAQVARKHCKVACIGCSLCKKSCPYDAIEIVNNLAVVNKNICIDKCQKAVCVEKCPTKAIKIFDINK